MKSGRRPCNRNAGSASSCSEGLGCKRTQSDPGDVAIRFTKGDFGANTFLRCNEIVVFAHVVPFGGALR
jgi:hypothetical protein